MYKNPVQLVIDAMLAEGIQARVKRQKLSLTDELIGYSLSAKKAESAYSKEPPEGPLQSRVVVAPEVLQGLISNSRT